VSDSMEVFMTKFKLGAMLGFALGWAVGSGRAAELLQRVRSSANGNMPGSVASQMERPAFDRTPDSGVSDGGSTAVSA
jgi:hypothetical protein